MPTYKLRGKHDEPAMSDLTILVSVEDLINIAMGPAEGNTINFKMIQTILHILARQMRLLETKVDIKIADLPETKKKKKRKASRLTPSESSSSETISEPTEDVDDEKSGRKKSKKSIAKEKKDKTSKEDVNQKIEKRAKKNKENEDKLLEKMSPEEKETYNKQKEVEEQLMKKMSPNEKANFLKQKDKELIELQQMSPKEKAKKLKEKEKELNDLKGMSSGDREKYFEKKAEEKSAKEKEQEKGESKSQKEKEDKIVEKMSPKEKELYLKQKEREEKALENMSPEEKELYRAQKAREKQALEKMSPKEREKYFEEKEKESKALEKMAPKERLKYLQEKNQSTKATGSGASITVTEVERQNEKILVVEKGPTTRRASKTGVGAIDVVTKSQFNLLQAEVERLKNVAAPVPMPALPDNKKLKADLVKGSASLTDTMQAMQVSARVEAAEKGLMRMAGLLAQLAASGVLPESFAGKLEEAKADLEALKSNLTGESGGHRKSVAIASFKEDRPDSYGPSGSRMSSKTDVARASIAMSIYSRRSRTSSAAGRPIAVTRNEMDDAIQSLREDMTKNMQNMTYRAASSAETAAGTARGIAEKMEFAMKINSRISDLWALTSDYAEQLSGFDAGLTTQMQSFQEQMMQMRDELKGGLQVLDTANNNAETAAILELTDRYLDLHSEIDEGFVEHQRLIAYQSQLRDELRGLVIAVEMLKEQKADRDEVWDGLRDKADLMKLAGLLTEDGFRSEKEELDGRLELCYEKFDSQEAVWMGALKDLIDVTAEKAEIMQLLSIKDNTQSELRVIQERLDTLTVQLGEPKAAILTRLLSKDSTCGACKVPALMEATDKRAGKPFQMPALRPPPDGEPCGRENKIIVVEDDDTKRWVGGSHTLVPRSEPREMVPTQLAPAQPVKKYVGYGADGKAYNMEMELEPCIECNKLSTDETGAGDMKVCDCIPRGDKCDCWPDVRAGQS